MLHLATSQNSLYPTRNWYGLDKTIYPISTSTITYCQSSFSLGYIYQFIGQKWTLPLTSSSISTKPLHFTTPTSSILHAAQYLSCCIPSKRPGLPDLVQLLPPLEQRFRDGRKFLLPAGDKHSLWRPFKTHQHDVVLPQWQDVRGYKLEPTPLGPPSSEIHEERKPDTHARKF